MTIHVGYCPETDQIYEIINTPIEDSDELGDYIVCYPNEIIYVLGEL